MDLERVAAAIRPRRPWEAIDLGLTLVQAWGRRIWGPWLAVGFPLWLGVLLAARGAPLVAFAILWWLRPLLDVIPLHVVSRALFGEKPTLRGTLGAALRSWLKVAPAYLGLERLDPARSFHLPVRLLEELGGRARWQRQSVLNRSGHLEAMLLTFACIVAQVLLFFAFFAFVMIMVPEGLSPDWGLLFRTYLDGGEAPLAYHLLWGLLGFASLTVIEPFYVAAGFTLYLNRRTDLEGWDVEIAFRRLARRLRDEAGGGRRGRARQAQTRQAQTRQGIAAALLLLAIGLPAAAAGADPTPKEAIDRVLEAPDFGRERTVRRWKWRFESDEQRSNGPGLELDWLGPLAESALWLLAGAGVAALAIYALRRSGLMDGGPAQGSLPVPSPITSGAAPAPEPLPADVAAEAWQRYEAGRVAEALSLLYRGALATLAVRRRLEIEPSWTEGECLRRLARQLSRGASEELARLTRAWQGVAYAHRPLAGEEMLALCAGYGRHFGPGAAG